MIKVLIADDHYLIRNGLKSILENVSDIEVVDEASNGKEAIIKSKFSSPDVIIMDINMPELNGIDASVAIIQNQPNTKILMLSINNESEFISESINAGAKGYLLKSAINEDIIKAIRTVANGYTYFHDQVDHIVVDEYIANLNGNKADQVNISKREQQVIKLIAEGFKNHEIGGKLNISSRTVETHRFNVMKKLNINSVAELIKYAIKNNICEI
ncbi:MAG: response regulator transcription factor [Bacteroidia bacterium]|nr:response regulator transcription factor [Bacteroidia bacterium]